MSDELPEDVEREIAKFYPKLNGQYAYDRACHGARLALASLDGVCFVCGQDPELAEIGRRMGFRVDVAVRENRALQAEVERLKRADELCANYRADPVHKSFAHLRLKELMGILARPAPAGEEAK